MNLSFIFFIVVILLAMLMYLNGNLRSILGRSKQNKHRIVDWMEMTKDQRKEIDAREKQKTLKRKKALLEAIRREYKSIKK